MSRLIIWVSMVLLGWTGTKLWTLKYGSKSIQTSLILRQRPPKPHKLLKFFMISVILFKMGKHSDFHLSFFQIVGAWRGFTVVTKMMKNFKSLYGFGGRCLKIRDVCMDLSHVSRSITWSLFTLKASYLVKWSISTWSFMWWCQFIDWLKFETRPSSLLNFGTAYWAKSCRAFSWFSVLWTKIGEFLGKVMNFKLLTLILFCFLTYSYKCLPLQLLSSRTTWPGQEFSSSFFRTFPSISLTSNRNGFSYY